MVRSSDETGFRVCGAKPIHRYSLPPANQISFVHEGVQELWISADFALIAVTGIDRPGSGDHIPPPAAPAAD